jgi:hypothetical protein
VSGFYGENVAAGADFACGRLQKSGFVGVWTAELKTEGDEQEITNVTMLK